MEDRPRKNVSAFKKAALSTAQHCISISHDMTTRFKLRHARGRAGADIRIQLYMCIRGSRSSRHHPIKDATDIALACSEARGLCAPADVTETIMFISFLTFFSHLVVSPNHFLFLLISCVCKYNILSPPPPQKKKDILASYPGPSAFRVRAWVRG